MHPINDFRFAEKALAQTRPARLTWDGTALDKDEKLVLLWQHPEHPPVTMEVSGATDEAVEWDA